MEFTVRCDCGRLLPVTSASVGSEVRCACGQINSVPNLSELRLQAGKSSYQVSIAERINNLVASGELPPGDQCAECGKSTHDTLRILLECERPWQRESGIWHLIGMVLLHSLVFWAWLLSRPGQDATGRELVVRTPLRMCADCAARLKRRNRPREIKQLLAEVPIYFDLLEEYPRAVAIIED